MAHSNRQKLRDDRGGRTRHQDNKVKRKRYQSTFDLSARMAELRKWEADRQSGPAPKDAEGKKIRRRYSMKLSAQRRRYRTFERLAAIQVQEVKDGKALDPRVNQEMKVLNERFVGVLS